MAQQINKSIPSERPRKPGAPSGRIQMKALFCPVTEVYQIRDRGGWIRTRLGSGRHPTGSAGGLASTRLRAFCPPRGSPGSHQTAPRGRRVSPNEFPAQDLKQWLLWKGFAFRQGMVCFSSMGRIRLNPMIKRVPRLPPLP